MKCFCYVCHLKIPSPQNTAAKKRSNKAEEKWIDLIPLSLTAACSELAGKYWLNRPRDLGSQTCRKILALFWTEAKVSIFLGDNVRLLEVNQLPRILSYCFRKCQLPERMTKTHENMEGRKIPGSIVTINSKSWVTGQRWQGLVCDFKPQIRRSSPMWSTLCAEQM